MRVYKRLLLSCLAAAAPALGNVTVGVKNFRQLLASYAQMTGIDPTEPEIAAYFAQSKSRLPKLGRADEVSAPALLTVSALAGLFCMKMIASDASLEPAARRAHKQVDFTKPPAAALTDGVRRGVIDEYARLFWRRAATTTETAAMLDVFTQSAGGTGVTEADSQVVLRPVCTAMAASLDTIVN